MKRLISVWLFALMLTGCGRGVDIPTTDILDAVLARVAIGDAEIFCTDSVDCEVRFGDDMLRTLYGRLPDEGAVGAVALSKSSTGGEVHIWRAGSLSQRSVLERMLGERAALLARRENLFFANDPDAACCRAAVEVKGLYVMLFVTFDNAEALATALEMLG